MHARTTEPTPYPEVNSALQALHSAVSQTLGEQFAGLYLYGSLAGGSFNLQSSDIDFLVATREALPDELVRSLGEMHDRLAASGNLWAQRMEGDYIPLAALRRHDPLNSAYPHLGVDGHFGVEWHGSEAILQRWMLGQNGITLAGDDLQALVDPVSAAELRQAVAGLINEWWKPQLDEHTRLESEEYRTYAVLTMCRMLYTLKQGEIIPKPDAARWAQTHLERHWAGLIDQALAWKQGDTLPALPETLEFIRYTLEKLYG